MYNIYLCYFKTTAKFIVFWTVEGLAAARSRSGENNTQLFSKTLAPLRYLAEEAYQNTRHKAQTNARKREIY